MHDLDNNKIDKSSSSTSSNLNRSDRLNKNQIANTNIKISPLLPTASNSAILNREKRTRKPKSYDENFLVFNVSSSSNKNSNKIADNNQQQIFPDPKLKLENKKDTLTSDAAKIETNKNDIKYNVGDLVWSKVGGHPWWPCMISNSPNNLKSNNKEEASTFINDLSHVRYVGSTRQKCMYYVLFFGPSIEHAWVTESCLIEYKGIEAFKAYAQDQVDQASIKSAKEKLADRFQLKVSLTRREQWEKAVTEADFALGKHVTERKLYFLKKYSNRQKTKSKKK
jgi:hypothetical protein